MTTAGRFGGAAHTMPASLRCASGLLGAFGCGAARLHVDLCRCLTAACRGSSLD